MGNLGKALPAMHNLSAEHSHLTKGRPCVTSVVSLRIRFEPDLHAMNEQQQAAQW